MLLQCVLYMSLSWTDDRAQAAIENSTAAYADAGAGGDCRRPCSATSLWVPGDKCCETMWLPQFGELPVEQRRTVAGCAAREGPAAASTLWPWPRRQGLPSRMRRGAYQSRRHPLRPPDFTNVLAFSQDRQIREELMFGPDGAVAWLSHIQGTFYTPFAFERCGSGRPRRPALPSQSAPEIAAPACPHPRVQLSI